MPSDRLLPADVPYAPKQRHGARAADPHVDVYLIDPLVLHEPLSTLLATLNHIERRRLLARRTAHSRRLFLASHVGLRRILAGYLGITPAAVEFHDRSDVGKPELHEALASELQFNLSHTQGLAVAAISRESAVGVDVEWTGRRGDALAFARRYFSECELMQLERATPSARRGEFLKLWTRREAAAKFTGEGLPRTMAREADPDSRLPAPFSLYDLVLPSVEHVGALALAQEVGNPD